jgi:cell wall-associated NlpC family hydrolase
VKRKTLTLLAALAAGTVQAEDALVLRTDPGTRFFESTGKRHLASARELALQALAFVGIRYKYGGSSPDTGFDCSGLVRYVASQALGLMLPRDSRALSAVGAQVRSEDLQPGDLVFFNTLRKSFSHVGIYVGDRRFIHAPASGGSVELVDMREPYWHSRYDGARRLGI